MAEETKAPEETKETECCKVKKCKGDLRTFVIALLTSLIVVSLYHTGMWALRRCRAGKPAPVKLCPEMGRKHHGRMMRGPKTDRMMGGQVYVLVPMPGPMMQGPCQMMQGPCQMMQGPCPMMQGPCPMMQGPCPMTGRNPEMMPPREFNRDENRMQPDGRGRRFNRDGARGPAGDRREPGMNQPQPPKPADKPQPPKPADKPQPQKPADKPQPPKPAAPAPMPPAPAK